MSERLAGPVSIFHTGTPEQLRFWSSQNRFRAFVGGIGSGKTRAGCIEVLRQPGGSRGAVVAPTYPMLRDSTLATFLSLAGEHTVAEFNRAEMTMRLVNGTEVLWRSADAPDRLRGPNLGWVFLDEAALMTEEAFDISIGRLRLPPGRLWLTTTPQGFDWIYRVFQADTRPEYELIRASTFSNTFLPQHYLDSLREKYDGSWARQELEGEFVEWVDTPCYPDFQRAANCRPGLRGQMYRPDEPLVLCCDFNVRYMAWPVCQVVKGQPIVLTEVVCRQRATVPEMVRLFRNEYPAHPCGVHVYGDATGSNRSAQTGRSDYDLIREAFQDYPSRVSINALAKNPPPRDRINAVNRLLRGWTGQPRLLVDEKECPELITDFLQTEWDTTGTRELQVHNPEDPKAERSHETSGLGYWIYRTWPVAYNRTLPKAAPPREYRRLRGVVR